MKKLFTLIILALTLSVSAGAWAEQETTTGTTPTDQAAVTVKKSYKLTNAGTSSPAETFTLEQVGTGRVIDGEATISVPNLGTITGANFAEGAATTAGAIANMTIELPTYERVGVYEYILKETAGGTAGVTYLSRNIKLIVTVINGKEGKLRVAAVHTESEGKKSDTFENTYSAGKLNVSKTVAGNLGDENHYFDFAVTLTGETGKTYGTSYAVTGGSHTDNPTTITIGQKTTFKLKHGETLSIANLPYGVGYKVEETAANGYTTEKTGDTGTISAAEQTAAFTNTKNATIDMGVTTDSLPYVMLLGMVTLIGAAMIVKRYAFNG